MSIFTFFRQKSGRGVPCRTPPFPPGFTAYKDHPSTEEVPPGRGPQSGAAPVKNSNQFLVAGRVECGGRRVLSRFLSLALSKWTAGAAPIWGISRNRQPLYHGDTSYTLPSLLTGFFQFRPHQSLAIGQIVRFTFASPGLQRGQGKPVQLELKEISF
jgi:hypothetical protein